MTACAVSGAALSETRVSGAYLAADAITVNMLQLTEAPKGHVTGILTILRLGKDGRTSSERGTVSGTVADNTIVLAVKFDPIGLTTVRVAGQADGNAVRLQAVSDKGEVINWTMVRSSIADFEVAAQRLRMRAQELSVAANLSKQIEIADKNLRAVEAWIVQATGSIQKLPGVKAQYRALSERMTALVKRTQVTTDDVARGQLSVAVSQGEIAGDQADIKGRLVWDRLERSGRDFEKMFQSYRVSCATADDLKARGAPPVSVHRWNTICQGISQSEQRFAPVFQRVLLEFIELKRFHAEEKRKRTHLVQETSRYE